MSNEYNNQIQKGEKEENKEATFYEWLRCGMISESAFNVLLSTFNKTENVADTNKREMKISIAISTYKRVNLLLRLIESIRMQDYKNYEIVIVDDASNDNTKEVISQYIKAHKEINIIFEENVTNLGVGESKKRAYQRTTGDILIFSDDDDYYIDPGYFNMLNDAYQNDPDCSVTIAPTLVFYEKEDIYSIQKINEINGMPTREFLNGFGMRYQKPNSMFTLSMRAEKVCQIALDQLEYFNDTPIYLSALLAEGKVHVFNYAVGVYYINGLNMTGNARVDYIIGNLDAKVKIYERAMRLKLIDEPSKWYHYQLQDTASYYLEENKDVRPEDKIVWRWAKEHFSTQEYYRFVFRTIKRRVRRGLPVKISYIPII